MEGFVCDFSPVANQVFTCPGFRELAGFYFSVWVHRLRSEMNSMLPSPRASLGRVIICRTEGHMTQRATLEFPGGAAGEHGLGERTPLPSVAERFGSGRRIGRSEVRGGLRVTMWLTSLQRPAVIEIAPTENISRTGMQVVAREPWKPAELVLVSSPPGFCVRGSVIYCKRLPSDEYLLGIGLDAPVEDWAKALGFTKF